MMRAGRTSTTPVTSPAMSGLRRWSSYLYIYMHISVVFSFFLSFYLCSIAVESSSVWLLLLLSKQMVLSAQEAGQNF